MRRTRSARVDTRGSQATGANPNASGMRSVLVLSGQGKATRYLSITRWRVGLLAFLLVNGLAISFLLGLFLHDATPPHKNLWIFQHRQSASPSISKSPSFFSALALTKEPSREKKVQTLLASKLAKQLGFGTRLAAGQLLAGQVKPEWLKAAGEGWHIPQTLMWPVPEGWYVRGYGSGEAGYHLAVDIMAKTGSAIRAAAPGVVAYANNDIRGYGNMVILIHPGGWVTVYAHNASNMVSVGERVGTGRLLALLGSTGISRGPHLHFEFIYKGNNCNPTPLFRPGIRHRYGNRFPIKQVVWNPLGKRPAEIQCQRRRRHPRSYYYELHPERNPYIDHKKPRSPDVDEVTEINRFESTLSEGMSAVEESSVEMRLLEEPKVKASEVEIVKSKRPEGEVQADNPEPESMASNKRSAAAIDEALPKQESPKEEKVVEETGKAKISEEQKPERNAPPLEKPVDNAVEVTAPKNDRITAPATSEPFSIEDRTVH
ncbi:MAG: peptidoglycan DD-metalloendopeptidase family protein [Deltaproteobacteria bacterium]|nr:peptidoglycan DD-metalloendopeptidase family protein [Deltaproteobacteria bacterium]